MTLIIRMFDKRCVCLLRQPASLLPWHSSVAFIRSRRHQPPQLGEDVLGRETSSQPFLSTEGGEPLHSNNRAHTDPHGSVSASHSQLSWNPYMLCTTQNQPHFCLALCLLVTCLHSSLSHLSTDGNKYCVVRPCYIPGALC